MGRITAFYELFLKLRKPSHEEEMQMYHTVRDIVEARKKFDGYAEVCARLTQSDGYLPTGKTTDFDSLLKERLHNVENESSSEPGHSDVEGLQEMFVNETRIPLSSITGRFDDDDDILEVGGALRSSLAKNLRCPITMVDILNLREPVEDSVGYVYEQEAIKELIYKKGRKGKTSIPCPEAGTQHTVSLSDLRPARKVLEAKARASMHTSR